MNGTMAKKTVLDWKLSRLLPELAWLAVPPLAFLLGMLRFFPYWKSIWLVNDEGYNLMKAMLVERGYQLYSQIWSDQAPLLTYLLAGLFRLAGYQVDYSRKLILLFSCVLIWAVISYIRLTWGKLHAIVGALILVLLPNFLVLSAAVLVGQPSLTFALLSMLALAGWHLRRRQVWIILSAVALSLSLLSKLFTGFLVPIFFLGLLAAEYVRAGPKRDWVKVLLPAFFWGFTLLVVTVGIGLLMVNPADAGQLIFPHWSAAVATEYPQNEQLQSINYYLLPAWPVLLAALVGIAAAWIRQRWLAFYPLAWMASAYLALLIDKPVWWHHQVLVTYPATILAAGAIGESLRLLYDAVRYPPRLRQFRPLFIAGLVCLTLIAAVRVPDVALFLQNGQTVRTGERNPAEEKFLRKIVQFAPQTHWMLTDMPMLSFMAGLPVPPDLTVISWKRIAAGELTEEEILRTIRQYRPEQVLFGRFDFPTVDQYLSDRYRVVHQRGTMKLYIRKDLQKTNFQP